MKITYYDINLVVTAVFERMVGLRSHHDIFGAKVG